MRIKSIPMCCLLLVLYTETVTSKNTEYEN